MAACFFLVVSVFPLFSSEEGLRIAGDIEASPMVYDPVYAIIGLTLRTSCMVGYMSGSYTAGVEGAFDYSFFEGEVESGGSVGGNWTTLRVLFDQYFEPDSFYSIKWGTGFIWLNNSLETSGTGSETLDCYGITFQFHLKIIPPWDFIDIETIHRIDLLYSFNDRGGITSMAPHYYGGLRINAHPGLPWLTVYLDSYIKYWSYSGGTQDIDTGIVNAGIGVAFDLPLGGSQTEQTVVHEGGIETAAVNEETTPPALLPLKNGKKGDKIHIHNIRFKTNTDTLMAESIPVLEDIIKILEENPHLAVSISAYTEYMENPAEEYKLYTSRAKRIKDFFVERGIGEHRLKISSIGQIVLSNEDKSPTVVFEIIDNGTR